MKLVLLTALLFSCLSFCSSTVKERLQACKCFPGDPCWPSDKDWKAFNATVGGRLVKTVPLGSPCHDPNFNAALCKQLATEWTSTPVHINSSSSVQSPIFANASCDPFTSQSSACKLGNYVHYAVKATGPEDIAATIKFADKRNIRFVIRNTAHDYMGRSTGAGGLAIWTHFLKSTEVKDWSDAEYSGKALKIGAGVLGHEALEAASGAGLIMVTGECPTVGLAGGYTQSGGHSPLSTAFGLGADQTLEFEVVTASGKFVKASVTTNPDLFWALSGAGAGNYGVVTAVTLKAHPDATTSGAAFTISQPGLDTSFVLNAWHKTLPAILDSGTMATYLATADMLAVFALTGYNRTKADVKKALGPFTSAMAAKGISLQTNYTQFDTYGKHYSYYFGPLPTGRFGTAGETLIGGRLLLRDALPDVGPAIKTSLQMGASFIGQSLNVSRFASRSRAVLPQWRSAAVMSAYALPYDFKVPFSQMQAQQNRITNDIMPLIEAVTPNAGAYINEADFQQKDWQQVFYGANYERLLTIKHKWDPKGIFYNPIAVGSERFSVRADGRLCKAS